MKDWAKEQEREAGRCERVSGGVCVCVVGLSAGHGASLF